MLVWPPMDYDDHLPMADDGEVWEDEELRGDES